METPPPLPTCFGSSSHSLQIDPTPRRPRNSSGSAIRFLIRWPGSLLSLGGGGDCCRGHCGWIGSEQSRERSSLKSSMMMGTEVRSSRMLSMPRYESCDEELSVLPPHTKVVVMGNNRTKSVLVGLQGVVKKAVGLGGWHWLVLKNGVEVKLQRNALSVLEAPTGKEDDDEIDGNNSFCSSAGVGEKDMDYSSVDYQKSTKPRIRHTRPWSSCTKSSIRGNSHSSSKLRTRVNLAKLGTPTLWRYWKHFNLVSMNPNPSKEQLSHGVQQHFQESQQLDELQVILGFIQTAKRLKTLYNSS